MLTLILFKNMDKAVRLLVSNIGLPSDKIGSWTTRLGLFISDRPNAFDYILSPKKSNNKSIFCKKRSIITWRKSLRNFQLLNWVALDYIKCIKHLSTKHSKLIIVVMDDPHLVEAIGLIKNKLKCEVELCFSFHGFQLSLNQQVLLSINKIFFLSKLAYDLNKKKYEIFPEGFIVGNAVDSKTFYPLNIQDFNDNRLAMGYLESDYILLWMANDRPKKGFHIFEKVALQLLKEYQDLKIVVIGTTKRINHPRIKNVGRIRNQEVARYLQIGNSYMFTTLYEEGFGLSMIEAYKCGNAVFASNLGAIPEVLHGLTKGYLINNPNNINSWLHSFRKEKLIEQNNRLNKIQASTIWNYEEWENKFNNAIQ